MFESGQRVLYTDFNDETGEEFETEVTFVELFYEDGDPIPGANIRFDNGLHLSIDSQYLRPLK